eukprot:g6947.t1
MAGRSSGIVLFGVVGASLLHAVWSKSTTCFDVADVRYKCNPGGSILDLGFCGITDDDVAAGRLQSCIRKVGPTGITQLNLEGNNLKTLPPGIFDSLEALTSLSLRLNALSVLPPGIFDSLEALTSLNLEGNKLKTLPPGIFDSLKALKTLVWDGVEVSHAGEWNAEDIVEFVAGVSFASIAFLQTYVALRRWRTTAYRGYLWQAVYVSGLVALVVYYMQFSLWAVLYPNASKVCDLIFLEVCSLSLIVVRYLRGSSFIRSRVGASVDPFLGDDYYTQSAPNRALVHTLARRQNAATETTVNAAGDAAAVV